ncbi:aspartyl/asparaginyl beta-hydroxylase domain-containing protein [Bacteroidales bacterium AH-315-I05]|nr:aspartyl/asparaginyl beta-hydroxylase domain-containing protein [Bacteroidales bacterium AH-315-I05]
MSEQKIRKPYYYLADGWYKGAKPAFYNAHDFPAGKILEENYLVIKKEIEDYYAKHAAEIKPNFTPYGYKEKGWKTINLYSYFLKYPKNCCKFPQLDKIVNSIRGMCLTQIAVLEPGTRIKAHMGDTDAIVRSHLGITIPGKHPDLGLRILNEERGWEEGKVLSFCIVNRHYAWNYTDKVRIILMVDVIREDFFGERYRIAGKTLACIAMKLMATKIPILKKMSKPLVVVIHNLLGMIFLMRLWVQRKLGL